MSWLQPLIESRRRALHDLLDGPMRALAALCASRWATPEAVDDALSRGMAELPLCSLMYVVDPGGIQRSANIRYGVMDKSYRGQDLSGRPYLLRAGECRGLSVSEVYIDRVTRRSCVTALQPIRDSSGELLGCLAADFILGDLPLDGEAAQPESRWRQIRGDPAIRSTLFQQCRAESAMDRQLSDVLATVEELMSERGVFHAKLHFSSARATLWLVDDPCRYRLHVLEEILDPAVCLAYPPRAYPAEATVPPTRIGTVLNRFHTLRDADETIYLRSASLNVINGLVGLTFSCDGSHYMPAEEFLQKNIAFWFGTGQEKSPPNCGGP
jgi:hypothetical protein